MLLPDFHEASQGRKIFPLPPPPEVVYELLSHPKLFRYASVRLRLWSDLVLPLEFPRRGSVQVSMPLTRLQSARWVLS